MKKTIFSTMALLLAAVSGCGSTPPATPSACATVTCAADQFCDGATGACKTASVCAGVTCSAGTVCDGTSGSATMGTCVTQTCGATMCTNGQVCSQTTVSCVNPGVPMLGVQIDRMGRPAVNTALTNPYDILPAANAQSGEVTKGRYNADSTPATWAATWGPYIGPNIAILDGLDGGACGNNFAYNMPAGSLYGTLTGVLATDMLLVDTSKATCTQYLALEAGVANQCGGRTLAYDVIDVTYSVLATNALNTPAATDRIPAPTVNAPTATFPYFANPI